MTDTTTVPRPVLATIAKHGAPERALWFGPADVPALAKGEPCSITHSAGGWRVQVDGCKPWYVGPRTRVWLALIPEPEQPAPAPAEFVRNPWSVVLRLDRPTLDAYRYLAAVLADAATTADTTATVARNAGATDAAADFRAVRDTLRSASTAALLGRLSNNPTPCRRCGAACTNCTPPPVPA